MPDCPGATTTTTQTDIPPERATEYGILAQLSEKRKWNYRCYKPCAARCAPRRRLRVAPLVELRARGRRYVNARKGKKTNKPIQRGRKCQVRWAGPGRQRAGALRALFFSVAACSLSVFCLPLRMAKSFVAWSHFAPAGWWEAGGGVVLLAAEYYSCLQPRPLVRAVAPQCGGASLTVHTGWPSAT